MSNHINPDVANVFAAKKKSGVFKSFLGGRRTSQNMFGTLLLLFLLLSVIYPTALIILNSFNVARPGDAFHFSTQGWFTTLTDRAMRESIWNTISLTVVRQSIAFPIAIFIAWLIARTDIPHGKWLEFAFWLSFFLPTLPVILSWILLIDPNFGIINMLLKKLPFIETSPFSPYSYFGLVWAHLVTSTISIKVMLLTPAFRNLDSSLEEASRVAGANNFFTMIRVVVPVLMPTILVTVILSVVYSLQAFEIEKVLGSPFGFNVYSTSIYSLVQQEPPQFASASVLSVVILLLSVPLILWQRSVSMKRTYTTVGGQHRANVIRLHKWRKPFYLFVLIWALILTAVPIVLLMMATLMKLFGFFNMEQPWTLDHWKTVLTDSIFLRSVLNTFVMSLGAMVFGMIAFPLVAYVAVRTKYKGSALVDYISWLPHGLPGIILGLGLLWAVLGTPFLVPLYGSTFILILACVISGMPLGTQMTKSSILQIGKELEEAGRVTGGNWLQMYWRILVPIMMPMIMTAGIITYVSAARNVSHVALLATSSGRPLALLQLDFIIQGSYESAAVVGVIIMLMTTGVALIMRAFGLKI